MDKVQKPNISVNYASNLNSLNLIILNLTELYIFLVKIKCSENKYVTMFQVTQPLLKTQLSCKTGDI
jgi:hypothetical protein